MDWKKNFDFMTTYDGERYYRSGRVKKLQKIGNNYTANVEGTKNYRTTISIRPNNELRMSCSCTSAANGNNCKHMAALFLEMEKVFGDDIAYEQISKNKASDPEVKPFAIRNAPESKVYTYFDLSVITDKIAIKQSQLEKAKELVEKKEVTLNEVYFKSDFKYEFSEVQIGDLYAEYQRNGIGYPIDISFTEEKIESVECGVKGCTFHYYGGSSLRRKNEICVHTLAALLLLDKYIEENNPGDTTNYVAKNVISQCLSQKKKWKSSNSLQVMEDFRFEPKIEYDEEILALSFRIGADKLYAAKNLTELVENIENASTQKIGRNLGIDLSIHKVSKESQEWYDFVRKIVKEEIQRTNLMFHSSDYYYEDERIKNRIPLYGKRLDELFELLYQKGNPVIYHDKNNAEKKMLFMREKKFHMQLFIKGNYDKRNLLRGIIVYGNIPRFFKGEQADYFIEDKYLNRVSKSSMELLDPLFQISDGDEIEMEFSRKTLSDFYYHVMPMLDEYVEFIEEEPGLMDSYVSPKANFKFYLDAENDVFTCDVKVLYGEKETALFALPTQENVPNELRDMTAEMEVRYYISRYFPNLDEERSLFTMNRDENMVFEILEHGVNEFLSIGEVYCTDRLKRISIRKKMPMSVGVSLKSDIMNLDISSEEYSNEELLEILGSYRKRQKFHLLRNGDYLNLEDNNLQILEELIDSLHISSKEFLKGNIKVPAYRALYLDKLLEKNKSLYTERDKHFKALLKEFKTVSDSDFEVPASLQKTMRNYQTIGFRWLKTLEAYRFGGILADDMGLGKTIQVISVILGAKQEKQGGTSLIVAPASLVYNWKEEFMRFAPEIHAEVLSGSQAVRIERLNHYREYDVVITSYDSLKRDIAEYEDKEFRYQILDEAQYIKNHTTATAKAVKCINSKIKYALTGTPIENRLSELWSIFDYLMPGFLYSYENFRKEIETPVTKNKDKEAEKRLKRMISPFILRRLKQDVLTDLPEKLEEVQYAKFETKQQKLYDGQVVRMKTLLEKQSGREFAQSKIQILAELTKLRQICCDPALLYENFDGESAKRATCLELIKTAIEGEHRMLIFSQFTTMLSFLEADLLKEGIAYYKITGSTPKEERMRLVKKFNEGDVPVFLISLKAGGTGLNLVGADVVIHYDPWWNQAVQNQATDRAYRIGQKKVVTVYKLIAKGTIEEKIVKMQESKKNLADEILSGENGGLAQLSKEELLELL